MRKIDTLCVAMQLPLILLALLCGCQNTVHKANKHTLSGAATITYPCAVLIMPNGEKIKRLKKTVPDDDYDTIVDDNQYYMSVSVDYLDSVKVKKIDKSNAHSIAFRTSSGKKFTMKLDSINWGIILFNGKSRPINAAIAEISNDYESYMKK